MLRGPAGAFEQAHRRGGGEIERFGASAVGHPHGRIRHGDDLFRQAMRLVPEDERDGTGEIRRVELLGAARIHREDPVPARSQIRDRVTGRHPAHQRQMEHRARGRADGLGVVHVDRRSREHDAGCARGVGGAHDRAGVPRIADLVQHRDASTARELRPAPHRRRVPRPRSPAASRSRSAWPSRLDRHARPRRRSRGPGPPVRATRPRRRGSAPRAESRPAPRGCPARLRRGTDDPARASHACGAARRRRPWDS